MADVPGYPWLQTARDDVDVKDVDPILLKRMNALGKSRKQIITIFSGYRSAAYNKQVGGTSRDRLPRQRRPRRRLQPRSRRCRCQRLRAADLAVRVSLHRRRIAPLPSQGHPNEPSATRNRTPFYTT